jgi:hypothetical protein
MDNIDISFAFQDGARPVAVSDFLGTKRTEKTDHPIYTLRKRLRLWGEEWDALYVVLFFNENPGYWWRSVGYHRADVEKIVVLFDQEGKPAHVYFGAHSRAQGTWRAMGDAERLVVYVAPDSHGMYARPGVHWRIMGLANDVCGSRGGWYRPQPADFTDACTQSWSTLEHYQVEPGINSPQNVNEPPVRGSTLWERLFLFLPCVRERLAKVPSAEVITIVA